jgi:hypothetical protein
MTKAKNGLSFLNSKREKNSNAFSTHPETPAPRTHFPQNPLGDIRADPSARASHRTQGRPCPTSQSLRSGFEPASTGVPRFRAHHRHFTNRSATKTSDAMLLKKKGMRHSDICGISQPSSSEESHPLCIVQTQHWTASLPVSLSDPIANPTTRHLDFCLLMDSKANRQGDRDRDPPVC